MDKIFSNPESLGLLMVFSIPIVSVLAYYWHETVKTRSNNELKQSMLERGMSAQEIEQVINAGVKTDKKHAHKTAS
ncbi:MAG: hypothetical protein K9N55_05495 [Phycisphaerae bacterium]|nr:hypothetical protein [Phycisphaerae bacterium]